MRLDRPTIPGPRPDPTPERLSLLRELRVLDAGLRESRVDWRGELREGLRCAFGLRRTRRPAASPTVPSAPPAAAGPAHPVAATTDAGPSPAGAPALGTT